MSPEGGIDPRERDVNQRARAGIQLLLLRQVAVLLLTFGSGIVLARTLAPADFGRFAIALFIVVFASMLTELGLQSALIQRPGDLTEHDIGVAFTLQQAAVTVMVVCLWVVSSTTPQLAWLIRWLSLELYLMSWRGLSEALLERALQYERLAPIDVAGSVLYAVVAIVVAVFGGGALSFVIALLCSSLLRTVLLYRVAPWPVRAVFDRRAARGLLRVGLPVQVSRILNQSQFWITPTLVAALLGPEAVGFLNWAAGNGRKPLELLETVVRVSLPHFSILQHDVAEVERLLRRYVAVFALVCGLWLCVLMVAGHDLVAWVYTERWSPAVPAMVVFAGVGLLGSLRVIVETALIAFGRMDTAARVNVGGAIVTIIASVGLVLALGPIGIPVGQLVGTAVLLPALTARLGPGAVARTLSPGLVVLVPMAAGLGVGFLVHGVALSPPLRGCTTALAITVAYLLAAWRVGPAWLRSAGLQLGTRT